MKLKKKTALLIVTIILKWKSILDM